MSQSTFLPAFAKSVGGRRNTPPRARAATPHGLHTRDQAQEAGSTGPGPPAARPLPAVVTSPDRATPPLDQTAHLRPSRRPGFAGPRPEGERWSRPHGTRPAGPPHPPQGVDRYLRLRLPGSPVRNCGQPPDAGKASSTVEAVGTPAPRLVTAGGPRSCRVEPARDTAPSPATRPGAARTVRRGSRRGVPRAGHGCGNPPKHKGPTAARLFRPPGRFGGTVP